MSEIDKLLGEFEKRKQQEREAQEQEMKRASELREVTANVLKEKVFPILQDISKSILQKDHKSEVVATLVPDAFPHVDLKFTPIIKRGNIPVVISPYCIIFYSYKNWPNCCTARNSNRKGKARFI